MSARDPKKSAEFVGHVAMAHGSMLHTYLTKRMRAGESVDDMAQEVYLRLLRLQRSDLVREPAAYVYHLAAQVVGEERMREAKRPLLYDAKALDRAANLDGFTRRDDLPNQEHIEREVNRLLAGLGTLHRRIVVMCKQEGYSYKEAAEELEISVFKVKRCLVEANAKINAKLRKGR